MYSSIKKINPFQSRQSKASKSCLGVCLLLSVVVRAQEIVELYPKDVPNAKALGKKESFASGLYRGVSKPTLEAYLPEKEKASGAAVVIIPGGSYAVVVYAGEGIATAKQFAKNGVAAFVLKYRLPDDSVMQNKSIGPLQDAQQAMKYLRENGSKWNVDTSRIGVVGFSAGGHLASTLATHFEKPLIENNSHTSLRPAFQVVVYPVISMRDSLTHRDSRKNLLGANPSATVINDFSNELQVTVNTPPAYITHAADDKTVDVDNSIAYFEGLRRNGVPVEMHIYPKGGHGFIFRQPDWMDTLLLWMKKNKWL